MTEVVVNRCFGGFGLSPNAADAFAERKGGNYNTPEWDIPRDDPDLVAVVRELGDEASDKFAKLRIVEVPDDVEWQIEEYDGNEHVAEKHRTWA